MLDPQEEKRFDDLKAMCRELKVPAPPEIMIGLQVHDHNGVLTFDDVQRGHSWTRNGYNAMLYRSTAMTGIGGTVYQAGSTANKRSNASIYNDSWSQSIYNAMFIGTSDDAFSPENYTWTSIPNGVASGQMSYSSYAPTLAYDSGTTTWVTTITGIFNNNSGGSITVKEVGLYQNSYYIMHERSVLSPTVAVANGAQLTVTYLISMDFSAID